MEILGDYVGFALATAEVAPDLAYELRLILWPLSPQCITFDLLIEQFIRVDLRAIAGKED